jgi:hypothetical protein
MLPVDNKDTAANETIIPGSKKTSLLLLVHDEKAGAVEGVNARHLEHVRCRRAV